jgi:hypothetical protein
VTEECAVDLGSGMQWGYQTVPCLTGHGCIPFKIILGCGVVVFCARDAIELCSVVLCVCDYMWL